MSARTQYFHPANYPKTFSNRNTQLELGIMRPFYSVDSITLEAVRKIMSGSNAAELLKYGSPCGTERHIQAANVWMERYHLNPNREQVSFAAGSQNALNIVLATLFNYRDKIAVDEYTYPSFMGIANLLNVQTIPVKNDDYGMIPDELDKLCRLNKIKGIYLMPSCNNPTAILLSMERRYALAKTIKKYDLILIEDDAYTFLAPPDILSFLSLLPEQTVHISSVSKAISAGLRVAYLTYPEKFRTKIIKGTYNLNINTPLLNLEIISELVLSGDDITIINEKIALSQKRNIIFRRYFKPYSLQSNSLSFFQCIKLPQRYSSKAYSAKARVHGINVLSSDNFLVGDFAENPFIRVSICSPDSESELVSALEILSELLPKNAGEGMQKI